MDKTALKLLGCGAVGAAGAISAMLGVKMIYDGAEELELAYYDPESDKLDMYEASSKAAVKSVIGVTMSAFGGCLIGGAIGKAFDIGQNTIDAPVMITANTLEDAQDMLDNMKNIVVKEV